MTLLSSDRLGGPQTGGRSSFRGLARRRLRSARVSRFRTTWLLLTPVLEASRSSVTACSKVNLTVNGRSNSTHAPL
jgi:hypothetical protein